MEDTSLEDGLEKTLDSPALLESMTCIAVPHEMLLKQLLDSIFRVSSILAVEEGMLQLWKCHKIVKKCSEMR